MHTETISRVYIVCMYMYVSDSLCINAFWVQKKRIFFFLRLHKLFTPKRSGFNLCRNKQLRECSLTLLVLSRVRTVTQDIVVMVIIITYFI